MVSGTFGKSFNKKRAVIICGKKNMEEFWWICNKQMQQFPVMTTF